MLCKRGISFSRLQKQIHWFHWKLSSVKSKVFVYELTQFFICFSNDYIRLMHLQQWNFSRVKFSVRRVLHSSNKSLFEYFCSSKWRIWVRIFMQLEPFFDSGKWFWCELYFGSNKRIEFDSKRYEGIFFFQLLFRRVFSWDFSKFDESSFSHEGLVEFLEKSWGF